MEIAKANLICNIVEKSFWKRIGTAVLVIIAAGLPLIVHNSYYLHLCITVGINAILAMTFVFLLRIGLISMSIAAFWGVGAYASALLVLQLNFSFWLALPSAALVSALISLVTGYILVRSPGTGFVILSIVLGMVVVLVFGTFEVFGGYPGIQGIPIPDPISLPFGVGIEFGSKLSYYYLMLFLLLFTIIILAAIYAAWSGRAMTAIGQSPKLAEALGIDAFRYRLVGLTVAGAIAGLTGSFYAHYIGGLTPVVFDVFKTINIQVYAILGGIESVFLGPIVGSLILTFFPEWMRITEGVEPVITGSLLILLILFLPNGLLGLLHSKQHREKVIKAGPELARRIRKSLMNMVMHRTNLK